MRYNIEFENSSFGIKAIIKGIWQDTYSKLLIDKGIEELELNDGKGWQGDDLDFLKYFPNLKSLIIIDFKIKSIENIHLLNRLLKLEIYTYSKPPINFNAFPNLIECVFEWINGSDSLFEATSLKKLFINSYNKKNSDVFSKLFNLEELSILNSPIENLHGLSMLKNLNTLRIGNLKRISSLQGLQDLTNLEKLEIQRCKDISSISEVFKLRKLKHLSITDLGNIKSLKGIEHLTELEELFFYESTNIIDGDLSSLTKLKNIKKISFKNRKHYSHKREQFGNLYP